MTLSESLKILAFMLVLLVCLQCHVADQVQQDVFSLMKMQLDDRYGHCVLSDWNPNQVNPCTWSHVNCQDNGEVTAITLSSCGLTGILSPRIANLTTLQQLSLDSNSIAGRIPQEFGDLSNLVTLQLGRNNLNGSLPASLGSLLKLQTISLEGNYISGEIPPELGNLSSLVSLNLGRNDLSGSIPDSFGHLKKIQKLDLSGNRLTGNISSTLTGLQSLNYINLAYNNLSGEIPVQLLQVAQYDFTGNSLNCGQPSIPCAKRATSAGGKGKGWVIPTIVSLLAVFICFILFFGWIRRQRQGKQSIGYKLKVNVHQELEIEGSSSNITIFDFSHVLEATNGFSVENKLGQGGFGPVYKGQFPDGSDIAVKRLASHSGQGFREFKNEVQLIAKLQHRNLMKQDAPYLTGVNA